ncbi:MAG: methenyltetrahydromethanopterin cyclohydrolase [Halobacteria archaeon]|nr:methenyltetrahydromethanopterin cyclohydrolase [Halobacteria archaeon]
MDLNANALEMVDDAVEYSDSLSVDVHDYSNGARVLDFGVDAAGGIEAGLYYADISAAGLLSVDVETDGVTQAGTRTPLNYVDVWTDSPETALLTSQHAGWHIDHEGYRALASGPARALSDGAVDEEFGVICLESSTLPSPKSLDYIADECGVSTESLFAVVAPSTSTAGVVQTASRSAEVTLLRLESLGYDVSKVETVSGRSPVAPVVSDETESVGATNDGIIYGSEVHIRVADDSDVFSDLASSSSPDYGEPFVDVFDEAGSFDEIDDAVFAPASVTVDVVGGRTVTAGETNPEVLRESFGIDSQ